MKTSGSSEKIECRIPKLLSQRFSDVLNLLKSDEQCAPIRAQALPAKIIGISNGQELEQSTFQKGQIIHWTFGSELKRQRLSVEEEATSLMLDIKQHLNHASLQPSDIVSTVIILRSMADFAAINKVPLSLQTATY
jgi:diphthine-ammonia ligase